MSHLNIFNNLQSPKAETQQEGWQALADLPVSERFAARCPEGKWSGVSLVAFAAHRAMTGRWSRERVDGVLRSTLPEHLNQCTLSPDISDGMLLWLGGVRAIQKEPSRESRIVSTQSKLKSIMGHT